MTDEQETPIPKTTTITIPDLAPLTAAPDLMQRATALVVTNNDEREKALNVCKHLRAKERAVESALKEAIDSANKTHKVLTNLRRGMMLAFANPRKLIEPKITTFEEEEERKARAEKKRMEEEATKQGEEIQVAMAAEAEAAGDSDVAESIISSPAAVPMVDSPAGPPRVEGAGKTKRPKAELISFPGLIRWVAQDIPNRQHFLKHDQSALNREAVSRPNNLNIPGVRVVFQVNRTYRS